MKKLLTTLSILLIATAGYAQGKIYTETELKVQLPFGEANNTESSKIYTVERVIDGDTLKLTNGEEVQLIGIKAPEDEKMGQEATEFVRELIKGKEGKEVKLQFDVQERDKYGRLLAYVLILPPWYFRNEPYLELLPIEEENSDGKLNTKKVFLNATIIKSGYATPMTIPPNVKYADLFKELYEEARENKRGLWADREEVQSLDCEVVSDCEHLKCNSGWYKFCVGGNCLCISQ